MYGNNNGFSGGFTSGGFTSGSGGFTAGANNVNGTGSSVSQSHRTVQGVHGAMGSQNQNQGNMRGNNNSYNADYNMMDNSNSMSQPMEQKHANMLASGNSIEAETFRKENHIKLLSRADMCPAPLMSFEELENYNVPELYYRQFLQNQMGFSKPSPIQAQTWPVALSGRDMIGIAETGSGKTLSFLLPGAMNITQNGEHGRLQRGETGPIVLVLAPTRELAQQIEVEAQKLSMATNQQIRTTCLVGGVPKAPQARDLRYGREIVIATPGRLLDLLDDNRVGFSLHRVNYLCLDEADRMLDMGFEKDIRRITEMVKGGMYGQGKRVQTMLFSATWPKEVQKLARDLCSEDPVHIHIGEGTVGELKANNRITQNIEMVDSGNMHMLCNNHGINMVNDIENYKVERMIQIIKQEEKKAEDNAQVVGAPFKTIIFCMTKKGADWVQRRLGHMGALAIHGDKSQQDRDWTLNQFKMGTDGAAPAYGWQKNNHNSCNILIATDVAARGLDIKNVELVINYDFPLNIEDYVHRIGRTGRAGKFGVSYSFFCRDDLKTAPRSAFELVGIMNKAGQQIPDDLAQLAERGSRSAGKGGHPRYGGGGKGGYGGNNGYGNNKGNGKGKGGGFNNGGFGGGKNGGFNNNSYSNGGGFGGGNNNSYSFGGGKGGDNSFRNGPYSRAGQSGNDMWR